jgi:hypothetical protein
MRSLVNGMANTNKAERKFFRRGVFSIWALAALLIFLACDLLNPESSSNQSTLEALGATQTGLAQTVATLTQAAVDISEASPATWVPPLEPSLRPVEGTATPEPTSSRPAVDADERMLKSARILLFEDMSASRHIRYVKEALDRAGYFYLDVGSAKGWFKTQLLSPVEWDLVIAAAEARRDFGGEFFEYINAQVARGAGAVIEYYDIDSAPNGKIKPLLDRCGVEFQSDWFEPDLRVFFWLDPENPVFNQPNEIPNTLRNAERLWFGDLGDLMQIKRSGGQAAGDAVLLAGTNATWKDDHGVLASCVGGRVILQTFSSHEYAMNDMVALWQNYIYQTLKNHFAAYPPQVPTPAITVVPEATGEAPLSSPATPGPEYTYEYSCGGLLNARLMDAPLFEKDLFEHHASGTFLILRLELVNETENPVFIWDQDYSIEGVVNGRPVTYAPHKAATGYLYIESPNNLSQGLIQPGEHWRTRLAFDVDPRGQDWVFVVRPGSEFGEQMCEARIPLYR